MEAKSKINSKNKAADIIVYFIIGILYVYSLCRCVLSSTVLIVSSPVLFAASVAVIAVFYAVFYNKRTFWACIGITTVVLAAFLLRVRYFYIHYGMDMDIGIENSLVYTLWKYLTDTYLFVRGYLPYDLSYNHIIILILLLVLGLFAVLVLYVKFNFYLFSLLGIALFSVNWLMDYSRPNDAFLIFLFCFFVLFIKNMNMLSLKKNGQKAPVNDAFTLSVMPICMAVILIASNIPYADIDFNKQGFTDFFTKPVEGLNDILYLAFNPKYFSFQSTGFTGRHGELGGQVNLNGRGVMEVFANERTYLSGATRDVYTGRSWENSDGEYMPVGNYLGDLKNFEYFEYFETTNAYKFYQRGNMLSANSANSYSTLENIYINIGSARTGSIFRPQKAVDLIIDPNISILRNDLGDMRSEELLPKFANYSYSYLHTNSNNEELKELLRLSERHSYKKFFSVITEEINELNRILRSRRNARSENVFMNIGYYNELLSIYANTLSPYADMVYANYTTLPATVPDRVYELAKELTSECENDYDRIKAIENYLIQFPYTLAPSPVPRDMDFVDYFLFEGKEGYCTYYASAMAVLSRCLGIPSRYSEGYIMPAERTGNGSYFVTNRQAHSWAEIYFEGYGWVSFEATAPYSYSFYERTIPASASIFTDEFMEDPEYLDFINSMGLDYELSTTLSDSKNDTEILMEPITALRVMIMSAAVVLAGFLLTQLFIAIRVIQKTLFYKNIKKLKKNEQVLVYFKGMLKMTKYYKYPIKAEETPLKYSHRIGKRFAFKNDSLFMIDMVKIFYKAKFSGMEVTDTELQTIEDCYYELMDFIKSMRSRPTYVINRYLLNRL